MDNQLLNLNPQETYKDLVRSAQNLISQYPNIQILSYLTVSAFGYLLTLIDGYFDRDILMDVNDQSKRIFQRRLSEIAGKMSEIEQLKMLTIRYIQNLDDYSKFEILSVFDVIEDMLRQFINRYNELLVQ